MFSWTDGKPIAKISGGLNDGRVIYVTSEPISKCCYKCCNRCYTRPCCKKCCLPDPETKIGSAVKIIQGTLEPLLNDEERSVAYVTGPSGVGKSVYSSNLIKNYRKAFPDIPLYVISRTSAKDDPALKDLHGYQIPVDDDLVKNPIDISKELSGGSILLCDDIGTIQDEKQKKAIDKLIKDVMEVGRKMNIILVLTNHLIIADERKLARAILNEIHTLTIFPQGASFQQVEYALSKYFGLNARQIDEIMNLPSRWVTIHKTHPQCVVHEKGCYILKRESKYKKK